MERKNKRLLQIGLAAIAALWFVLLGWLVVDRFQLRRADAFQALALRPSQGDGEPPVLWKAPSFSAVDQDNQAVTDRTLEHHVWIGDFIFTRCTTACPLISAKMLLLRKAIVDPDIRFVSFSVDPEFDTPAVLGEYARRWSADGRWLLLRSKPSDVQEIARGMKVPLERTRDPDNPILHTTFFFLVDRSDHVRGVYDSVDDDAVERLIRDAQRLDGSPRSTARAAAAPNALNDTSAVERGHALFESVGCAACHADERVAPPLVGVSGRVVRFEGDASAMADDEYLRESIVDPNARVVAGYPALMPSYRDHLSDRQVADLVAYMRSTSAAAGPSPPAAAAASLQAATAATASAAAPVTVSSRDGPAPVGAPATGAPATEAPPIDPVCGMHVRASEQSPHTQYKGKTYYFCSDLCRDRFSKTPEKYTPGN